MRKFGRKTDNRNQMMKNITASIILYERVGTTISKAKEARSFVDKAINMGKSGTLTDRRKLLSMFTDKNVTKKIYEVLAPRYADRISGYTQIIHVGPRVGDGAKKVYIRLIPDKEPKKEVKSEKEVKETKDTSKTEK